jgi:4a-hydroxytetrahydrobiopterin dehydratase
MASGLRSDRKERKNVSELAGMKCTACRGGEPTLTDAQIEELRPQIRNWRVEEREGTKRLERTFRFDNFAQALAFTNKVGERVEEEGHHPALLPSGAGSRSRGGRTRSADCTGTTSSWRRGRTSSSEADTLLRHLARGPSSRPAPRGITAPARHRPGGPYPAGEEDYGENT